MGDTRDKTRVTEDTKIYYLAHTYSVSKENKMKKEHAIQNIGVRYGSVCGRYPSLDMNEGLHEP